MAVRAPAVAGMFYPATPNECRRLAQQYVTDGQKTANAVLSNIASSKKLIGGIVPHAGWICSGAVAGETIGAIAQSMPQADLVVVFGAVHTPMRLSAAALDSHQSWSEPGGESAVIEEVRSALAEKQDLFVVDDRFHRAEHAVEVELPLIQIAWPGAAILPVEVPPTMDAIQVGIATAKRAAQYTGQYTGQSNRNAVFLASSDLTHYGPNYRFTPAGIGLAALEWAKQNDQRLLDRVQKFDVNGVVPEVLQHHNACGAGAITAMLAACREFGATNATVIRQTCSYETLHDVAPRQQREPPDNSVGYASVVVS